MWEGKRGYRNYLYFLLNFSVNLELLYESLLKQTNKLGIVSPLGTDYQDGDRTKVEARTPVTGLL